ncbi:MAG TPA: hypothetical protein ENG14_03370 [Thermodesulforhabdus norvegica]|uniref:Uncharacterized protein n=1 Tax=Thermodesulforhabdus norvegica TaxID=39841 RepID=A0A7C0WRZ6_9BACT|nr:hypothetical protein [Thermodesulforhabdus norvegica]
MQLIPEQLVEGIGALILARGDGDNPMSELRSAGEITGGPPPLRKRDRSRFLQRPDEVIQSIRHEQPHNRT